jgi:LCP family protein required for cell wall assembly
VFGYFCQLALQGKKNLMRKRTFRIIMSLAILLLVILSGMLAYSYFNVERAVSRSYQKSGLKAAENGSKEEVLTGKKPLVVLLMGTDTGALGRDYKGRTDSIMVLVLNPRTKKSTIVSIERDFQVNFPQYPQYSPSKINAAYTYGGVKLLSQTLDRYFKIPVNTYALINMGGMKSIIDQLGGVDITPLLSFDYEGYSYKKGVTTHMNGDKALEYCRMRYDDPEGDYGRQKRQRQVLTAIIKSGADVQSLLKPAFLNSVSSQVRTDLTFSDLAQIAKSYRASGDQLETDYTHGTGFNQDGVSYQHISLAERQRISDLVRQAAGLKKVQLANGQ